MYEKIGDQKMLNYNSIQFGQKHLNFTREDYQIFKKLICLANKHQRICVYSCNGVGIIEGQYYYTGLSYGQEAGEYEKREYGYNVISAYIYKDDEETIFDIEIDKIWDKINKLVENTNFNIEYQGDPRGYTVKIKYNDSFIDY